MAKVYVATGHNNAAGLTLLTPEPAVRTGIIKAEARPAVSGSWFIQGSDSYVLHWSALDADEYDGLFDQVPVNGDTVISAEMTFRLLAGKDRKTYRTYNGVLKHVVSQDATFEGHVWNDVRFHIYRLTEI